MGWEVRGISGLRRGGKRRTLYFRSREVFIRLNVLFFSSKKVSERKGSDWELAGLKEKLIPSDRHNCCNSEW